MTPSERLETAIFQLVSLTSEANRLARASLQQAYTLGQLEARWGRSRDGVLGLLRKHAGYQGERGKRDPIHLNAVLRVDEALTKDESARLTQGAHALRLEIAS